MRVGLMGCENSNRGGHRISGVRHASIAASFVFALTGSAVSAEEWIVRSPDGEIEVQIRQEGSGPLAYRVEHEGRPVLGWSPLGLTITRIDNDRSKPLNVSDFTDTLAFAGAQTAVHNDDFEMRTGKRSANRASANALALDFIDSETGQPLAIDWRVYDEGFGFRYRLPKRDGDTAALRANNIHHWLTSETTGFSIGDGATLWGQVYDIAGVYEPAYETDWENAVASGTDARDFDGTGWGFPSLFQTPAGDWLLLHEANIGLNDHGSHLQPEARDGTYTIAPPLAESALGIGPNFSASPLPWAMPWRIGIIGSEAGDVAASNLTFHFADPSQVANADWVRPGLASWSWPTDHASSRNMDTLKKFIDVAAEMGFEYSLVDANWNTIAPDAMEQLVAYADARGVGLAFWYNSAGRHNAVEEEPRNIMSDPTRRRAEFARLQALGVKAVKVDFFHSDKQDVMRLYQDILRDAADHEVMVVFHGSTIPRGWERTWPNLMSMESVTGAEFYTFDSRVDYTTLAPMQNTILPFTRNAVGSMDYTPTIYRPQLIPRQTTNAHETALPVIFESGIQHIAASAEGLRALPEAYRAFFRDLPAAWKETRFLEGRPGEYVVIARQSHDGRWYVAGINGTGDSRRVDLDLSTLRIGNLSARLLMDGDNSQFAHDDLTIETERSFAIEMQPFGGFVLIEQTQ